MEIGYSAFAGQSIGTLDLSRCSKLERIDENAFYQSPIKVVKLPASIVVVGGGAIGDYVEEAYCAAPVSDDVIGHVVYKNGVLIVGCYGYSLDSLLYPEMLIVMHQSAFIITAVVLFIGTHAILGVSARVSMTYVAVSLLSAMDYGSDWFYFLFSTYMSMSLFWAAFVFTFCVPIVNFTVMVIVRHRLLPHFVFEWYLGRIISHRCKWHWLWIWLSTNKGAPLVNNRRQSFTFQHHDSLPKVFIFVISWAVLLGLQLLSLLPFIAWIILLSPYYVFLVIIGSFLYHTKLLAHKHVWNSWVTLFTSPRGNRYTKISTFDTKLLNYSMFVQLVVSSIPLLIVKAINGNVYLHYQPSSTPGSKPSSLTGYTHVMIYAYNTYVMYEWYLISLVISLVFIVVGAYRYVYVVLHHKVTVAEAPFSVSFSSSKDRKSVGIAASREDIAFNTAALMSYRKRWRERLIRNRIDVSMSSVLKLVTRVFLRDGSNDINTLFKVRTGFTETMLISIGHGRNKSINDIESPVDNYELAAQLFQILLQDSVDMSMYRVLRAAGIKESGDLLDINERARDAILAALQCQELLGIVSSYLNVITCDKFAQRNSHHTVVGADDNSTNLIDAVGNTSDACVSYVTDFTEIQEEQDEEASQVAFTSSTSNYPDNSSAASTSKPVSESSSSVRKVVNRYFAAGAIYDTSDATADNIIAPSKSIVNNPSIRKVKNRQIVGVASNDDEDNNIVSNTVTTKSR